jgi:hypothetical protein
MKKGGMVLLAMLIMQHIFGQTVLSEGRVMYDVFLNNSGSEPQGTLLVTLKGGFMKRDLIMKNGYLNTIIYNSKLNKTSSYSELQGNKVSKNLGTAELKAANLKFENALYTANTETKKIAGYDATMVSVTYTDGSKNTVYYTTQVKPQIKEYNAMFNKIEGLPLQYEVVSGNNKIIMIAKTIKMEPVNNSEFDPLEGYQLVD